MRSKISSGVRRAYDKGKRTFNRAKNYFNRDKRAIQDTPPVEPLADDILNTQKLRVRKEAARQAAEELEGLEDIDDPLTPGQLNTMGKNRDAGLQQALKNGLLEGPVEGKSVWVG